MKADMIRLLMIGRTKEVECCKWNLDYPMFQTVLRRAFALDMAARGTYEFNSTDYNRIKDMFREFVKLWTGTVHTHGEWEESKVFKNKNFLCLVFGLGDACDKCADHHVDIFDSQHECELKNGTTRADKS